MAGVSVYWTAQAQSTPDYLSSELRSRVEQLKQEFRQTPTGAENVGQRSRVVWDWVNAYSLTGGPVPAQSLMTGSDVEQLLQGGSLTFDQSAAAGTRLYKQVDDLIHEFALKDERPGSVGSIEVSSRGPFASRSYQTLEYVYTTGDRGLPVGAWFMVGRARQQASDLSVIPQFDDPRADNYTSVRSSNPRARFSERKIFWAGVHGGFRTRALNMVFDLADAALEPGDTVTFTIGDRSRGSRGWLMQNFQNDEVVIPFYVDLDGRGPLITLNWPSFEVIGKEAAMVRGVAPSIVATGEAFTLRIRTGDEFFNRASGRIPEYSVTLNGDPFRTVPAGDDAIASLDGIVLENPGTYRFGIESADGKIVGSSNPVWVQDDPKHRIYWGDTHGHTGMAEGMGTADGYYRYGRDDAMLDFLGLSEHDIVIDALEWKKMQKAVDDYTREEEFIAYLGYEWTLNRPSGGHHNVFYRSNEADLVPAAKFPRLALLYQGLRERFSTDDVLIIPHAHQAADWRMNDPDMEKVIEIQSQHGTFEWFGNYYLQRGFEVGFVAASDNHNLKPGYSGTKEAASLASIGGLAGVLAPQKTTDAIFDAMRARRTYATTDAERILMDVRLNGGLIGTRQPSNDERRLECRVSGSAPIDELAVIKNGQVVFARNPSRAPLSPRVSLQVRFESDSEPYIRDNPRPYRRWKGTIKVINARLDGVDTPHFENRFLEYAKIDDNDASQVVFYTETRGRADILTLELSGASSATELRIELEETEESGGSPPRVRDLQTIPAESLAMNLGELRQGVLTKELPVGRHRDTITMQLINSDGPMDQELTFVDNDNKLDGDYYYVRVKQLNGAWAWSSPIWVGGEPRH